MLQLSINKFSGTFFVCLLVLNKYIIKRRVSCNLLNHDHCAQNAGSNLKKKDNRVGSGSDSSPVVSLVSY